MAQSCDDFQASDWRVESVVKNINQNFEAAQKMVYRAFSRLYGAEFKLDTSRHGWRDFKEAVKLRNGITHPKDVHSFDISASALDKLEKVRQWYADSTEALFELCQDTEPS